MSQRRFAYRSSQRKPQDTSTSFQETDFYHTIRDNNLFRLIGWAPPRSHEPYRLIGKILPTNGDTQSQWILQATIENTTHTVSSGETLGDFIQINIQPKQVTLEKAEHQRNLKLNTTTFLK